MLFTTRNVNKIIIIALINLSTSSHVWDEGVCVLSTGIISMQILGLSHVKIKIFHTNYLKK